MRTGQVREYDLSDRVSEFGMINDRHRGQEYRYTYAAQNKPGWFLFNGVVKHDLLTGTETSYEFDEGVFCSETAMAPRVGASAEDDGYLVTITVDMNRDLSECLVLDAQRVEDGPIARIRLPERVSSGTHSTWASGAEIPGWRTSDSMTAPLGL